MMKKDFAFIVLLMSMFILPLLLFRYVIFVNIPIVSMFSDDILNTFSSFLALCCLMFTAYAVKKYELNLNFLGGFKMKKLIAFVVLFSVQSVAIFFLMKGCLWLMIPDLNNSELFLISNRLCVLAALLCAGVYMHFIRIDTFVKDIPKGAFVYDAGLEKFFSMFDAPAQLWFWDKRIRGKKIFESVSVKVTIPLKYFFIAYGVDLENKYSFGDFRYTVEVKAKKDKEAVEKSYKYFRQNNCSVREENLKKILHDINEKYFDDFVKLFISTKKPEESDFYKIIVKYLDPLIEDVGLEAQSASFVVDEGSKRRM